MGWNGIEIVQVEIFQLPQIGLNGTDKDTKTMGEVKHDYL